jgi:hypothetical protein
VNFAGNATLLGGISLVMELGGTTPGTGYDQIHVAGQLAVGGALSLSLINGFAPTVGSAFDLLDWGTLAGTFSSLSLPVLASGQQWDSSLLYTTGVLSVVAAPLLGDFDSNGVVDAADYVVWRKNGGTQTEYNTWRANFGQTADSGSGSESGQSQSTAVPEPASAMLLFVTLAKLASQRRRTML